MSFPALLLVFNYTLIVVDGLWMRLLVLSRLYPLFYPNAPALFPRSPDFLGTHDGAIPRIWLTSGRECCAPAPLARYPFLSLTDAAPLCVGYHVSYTML